MKKIQRKIKIKIRMSLKDGTFRVLKLHMDTWKIIQK